MISHASLFANMLFRALGQDTSLYFNRGVRDPRAAPSMVTDYRPIDRCQCVTIKKISADDDGLVVCVRSLHLEAWATGSSGSKPFPGAWCFAEISKCTQAGAIFSFFDTERRHAVSCLFFPPAVRCTCARECNKLCLGVGPALRPGSR